MQPHNLDSCEEYKRDISTFIDDELPEKRKSTLLMHIKKCPDCFLELELQQKIENLVQNNLEFLTNDFIGENANTMIATSIMERVRQQSSFSEDHHKHPEKQHAKPLPSNDSGKGGKGTGSRLFFSPRPLIITSAASLLILLGGSTSMLYSFSNVQHESLSDGSSVLVVSDIDQ